MRPISKRVRRIIDADPYYRRCARHAEGECSGRLTMEHAFIYAGRQIDEAWAIVPLCWYHHLDQKGLNKRLNELLALRRATPEDLKKYPRTDWGQLRSYLEKSMGEAANGKCCEKQFVYTGGGGTSHYCCPEHCCPPNVAAAIQEGIAEEDARRDREIVAMLDAGCKVHYVKDEDERLQAAWDEVMHGTNPATIYGTRRLEWENVLEIGVFAAKFNAFFDLLMNTRQDVLGEVKMAVEKLLATGGKAGRVAEAVGKLPTTVGPIAQARKDGYRVGLQELQNILEQLCQKKK